MDQITKSRRAMIVAIGAAFLYAVGLAFDAAAIAVLSTPSSFGLANNLRHAGDWLQFAGAVVALLGICVVGWELVLRKVMANLWEVGAAAIATLLIAIGTLVNAASPSSESTGNVLGAIGIGCWALLVLSRAARSSLSEQEQEQEPGLPRQAALWLGAAAGLFLLAVGSGFTVDFSDQGLGIAQGTIEALGVGLLSATVAVARNRRVLSSRSTPTVIGGLSIIALSFVGAAIVSGIVFTPSGTLTELRIGVPLVLAVQAIGIAILAIAAWLRVSELQAVAAQTFSTVGSWTTPSPETSGAPQAASTIASFCTRCGSPLPQGASFCAKCGNAVAAGPTP